jgi:hypothetical protein
MRWVWERALLEGEPCRNRLTSTRRAPGIWSCATKRRIGVTNLRDYNRNKEAVVRDIYATIFDSRGWAPCK